MALDPDDQDLLVMVADDAPECHGLAEYLESPVVVVE